MSSVKHRKEKDCLNCGHIVEENFCTRCGQENIVTKEDAIHMVTHAVADYFHFEHKFFGTLGPLMLKPGSLTKDYVAGKRMSSIHPIRLYIFISIVFFLVILSGSEKKYDETPVKKTETKNVKLTPKQQDSVVNASIKELEKGLKYIPTSKKKKDSIINAVRQDIKKGGSTNINLVTGKKNDFKVFWEPKDSSLVAYEKHQSALPKNKRDGFLKHYVNKRIIELNKYPNPKEKFFEGIMHNIPKMMFLLLPMFALILKLVYINKNRYYYEHLIYSFHVHSALFLSILVTMLLQWLFGFIYEIDSWLGILCFGYITWYIYRSLRTFYGSSRWVTILKIIFLNFCYTFVLSICFLIIIALSFAIA